MTNAVEKIAVSADLSEASRQAFPIAAALARKFSSEIAAVYLAEFVPGVVLPPGMPSIGVEEFHGMLDELESRLADFVSSSDAFEGLEVKTHVVRYGTLDAYEEFLVGEHFDLVVLATHGHRGLKRIFAGSFAEKALRSAHCPVLVCHPRDAAESERPGFAPERILVPTDFSTGNGVTLGVAADWARAFGASVRLFHDIEHDPGVFGYPQDAFAGWYEAQRALKEYSIEKLRAIIDEEFKGLNADFRIASGHPAAEIVRYAKEYRPDLIVMGSHGRTGWERFLLGSVAARVVHKVPFPVLVVKSEKREAAS